MTTAIHRLLDLGQSTWLDYIDRRLLDSGEFDQLIAYGGIRGVTSNPSIFQKAVSGSDAYDAFIRTAAPGETEARLLERLMVRDITDACDRLRPTYEASRGGDGFASLEVSPGLAGNTSGTIEEATRLWHEVGRPNLMVKIPGTREGVPAIAHCLAAGININVTLLFSVERYLEVADAYVGALEARVAERLPIDRVASVASFFISRIDAKVDPALDALPNALRGSAGVLRGRIGIVNAKRAYTEFERIVRSDRFAALASRGARPQRLLWASTSPKDPAYRDIYYAEELIGADTIDTMTPECLRAYVDHGSPEPRLTAGLDHAGEELVELAGLGIDLPRITGELERAGVSAFGKAYLEVMHAIAKKRAHPPAASPVTG